MSQSLDIWLMNDVFNAWHPSWPLPALLVGQVSNEGLLESGPEADLTASEEKL